MLRNPAGLSWASVSLVDLAVVAVMGVALLRGLAIGMVREAFSLAALAAACVAVRLGTEPGAAWLVANALPGVGPLGAKLLAGAGVGLAAALAVGLAGRLVRRGVRAAGLGLADRLAGAALGAAEGALVAGVVLLVAVTLLGPAHPLLARSQALSGFALLERLARGGESSFADVAAPPPTSKERGESRPPDPLRRRAR
jgi:uncharacterized membrane protein required for colicin V production